MHHPDDGLQLLNSVDVDTNHLDRPSCLRAAKSVHGKHECNRVELASYPHERRVHLAL